MANNHLGVPAEHRRSDEADVECDAGDDIDVPAAVLRAPRRQTLLTVLDDADARTLDRAAVASGIVAESSEGGSDARLQRRVEISLHHNHLPALAEAGVLEYEPESRLVRYDPNCIGRMRAAFE